MTLKEPLILGVTTGSGTNCQNIVSAAILFTLTENWNKAELIIADFQYYFQNKLYHFSMWSKLIAVNLILKRKKYIPEP